MPASSESRDDRNWYKVATLVLAAMMVILTFVSVVYYRFVDTRQTEIETISSKIVELVQRRETIARVPRVRVEIRTLKGSGLPESAFASLSHLPAVISVRHAGGETARGITIRLSSETEIVQVLPEEGVEMFGHALSSDSRAVFLQIPQLRAGSLIRATLMQRGLGDLSHATHIDVGQLVEERDLDDAETELRRFMQNYDLRRDVPSFASRLGALTPSDVRDITPDSFAELAQLDFTIERLKDLRRNIESRPLIDLGWRNAFLSSLIGALLSSVVACALLVVGVQYFNNRLRRGSLSTIRARSIVPGMATAEAQAQLGKWGRNKFIAVGDEEIAECWFYLPAERFLFADETLGCVVLVSNETVKRILYIKG